MSKKRRSSRRTSSPKRDRPARQVRPKETTGTAKYKAPEYVEYIFALEVGIFQADTVSLDLTDAQVLAALESLAVQIRASGLPYFREQPEHSEGLVTWLMVGNWRDDAFRQVGKLSKEEMIGCLETVIESVETRSSGQPNDRKYLNYLRKFMKRAGIRMELVSESDDAKDFLASHRLFQGHERMSLVELGRRWLRDPDYVEVRELFTNRVEALIAKGQARQVVQTCQKLIQQTEDSYLQLVFYLVMGRTYRHLGQTEQALDAFLEADSIDETNTEVLTELAQVRCVLGQHEQAIELWQECLAIAPEETHFYQKLAHTYRQMGDLVNEELAWRRLLKIRQRRGPWAKLWRRHRSVATLAHLVDCLHRQGKADEAQKIKQQMKNSWPHPDDAFDDWAYWVRSRLERELNIESMLASLRQYQSTMSAPIGSQVLQACIYDWQEQPSQSRPIWRSVERQLSSAARFEILNQAPEILGDLLPDSSRLFKLAPDKGST